MFKPSKKEEENLLKNVNEVINKINKLGDFKAVLGGSGAKGTWLKGSKEIDLFVKFNYKGYKDRSDKISDILEKKLKKAFKISKLHGSRDYFQIKMGKFTFEIVPILDIKKVEQAKNITDISPLHAKWVKKHDLQDEIRLTKAFAKAQDCYGAESYKRGFSGYVLEILTIHYKGFKNLLKSAVNWKDKTVIDTEKLLKNPLKELNMSKRQSPLIVVDPVDKTRNAAAVLSKEQFEKFKKAAKAYLKNPSDEFFTKKEKKILKESVVLEIEPLRGKEDIIGAKIVKVFEYIKKHIGLEGYEVVECDWKWDKKALIWYKVKNKKLSKYRIHQGPPIKAKKHLEKFKKRHKKIYISKGRAYIKLPRKFIKIKDFLKDLIKDKNIKEKVKSIKIRK